MDRMVLRIFQWEVERQCKFSLLAFEDLNQALKNQDGDRFWYSLQVFLGSYWKHLEIALAIQN